MTTLNWQAEKFRILGLPLEKRRKLYQTVFIPLKDLPTWSKYAVDKNDDLQSKKPYQEDISIVTHFNIDQRKNKYLAQKVSLCQMNITKLEVDAVVNAANILLQAGGGVDGAIHSAAGELLQEECETLGGCLVGEAKVTGGYNLPAKYVIHTVGPQDGSTADLQSCYDACYGHVKQLNLKSVAFPCVSTGLHRFPNRLAAHIALRATRKFLEENEDFERVILCMFKPIDLDIYEALMQLYFPLK